MKITQITEISQVTMATERSHCIPLGSPDFFMFLSESEHAKELIK